MLLLGGTEDARHCLPLLKEMSFEVIPSLAGRTKNPSLLPNSRIGSFGGIEGLKAYITQQNIAAIVDVTHPFALQITSNAYKAAQQTGIGYWRFERPAWQKQKGDIWKEFSSLEQIAHALPAKARCFLALGRQHIEIFSHRQDVFFTARMIESTDLVKKFIHLKICYGKPLSVEEEYQFLKNNNISVIVARNSGGKASYSKIEAARRYQCPVFLLQRPPLKIRAYNDLTHLKQAIYHYFSDKA